MFIGGRISAERDSVGGINEECAWSEKKRKPLLKISGCVSCVVKALRCVGRCRGWAGAGARNMWVILYTNWFGVHVRACVNALKAWSLEAGSGLPSAHMASVATNINISWFIKFHQITAWFYLWLLVALWQQELLHCLDSLAARDHYVLNCGLDLTLSIQKGALKASSNTGYVGSVTYSVWMVEQQFDWLL